MSGFKTDNNSGDIYYDDVEYTVRKVKKAKISTADGTNPGTVDINLEYQNTPGSTNYTVDSKISLVPGEGMSFLHNSNTGTITLTGTPKNKLDATRDPVKNDDSTKGYAIGSFWVNISVDVNGTRKNKAFLCTSALDGNAVWTTIDKMTVKSAAPTASNDGGSPDGTNEDRGYAIGSFWLDITTQTDPKLYVCVSNAVNNASWKEVGANSGPQVLLKTANPTPADGDPDFANSSIGTIWISMGPDFTNSHVVFMKLKAWTNTPPVGPTHIWKALNTYVTTTNPNNDALGDKFTTGSMWLNIIDQALWIAYSNYQNNTWTRITPYTLTTDPTTANKLPEGTIWVNTTNNTAWISLDKDDGIWQEIGAGGGGLNPIVSADPPAASNQEPEGTLWIESDTNQAWISVDQTNGTWQLIGKTIVSPSAPAITNKEPEGTLWVESDTDKAWISVDQNAGTWKLIGDGLPAGNNKEIQFNQNGVFGASSNLIYTDEPGKGGGLKQQADTTISSYNYYSYKTTLSTAGRAYFYSYHVPCTQYSYIGVDGNNVALAQDMDAYKSIHLVNASSGSVLLTLPEYGTTEYQISTGKVPAGHILTIKRVDAGSTSANNVVAIEPGSGVLIDGFSGTPIYLDQRKFVTLYLTYDSNTLIKNWVIISA